MQVCELDQELVKNLEPLHFKVPSNLTGTSSRGFPLTLELDNIGLDNIG
jgi:hypothetical protein